MPKIVDVKDKETGEVLQMQAVDAREAVDNDPRRYSMKGYSKAAEEPTDPVPARAKPPQTVNRRMSAKARAAAANLSATSGEPDKAENPAAVARLERQAAGDNPAAPAPAAARTRRKSTAKKK